MGRTFGLQPCDRWDLGEDWRPLAFLFAVGWFVITWGLNSGQPSEYEATYLVQARELASEGPVRWADGYPAILAGSAQLLGVQPTVELARGFSLLGMLVGLLMTFRLYQHLVGARTAGWAVVLTMLSPAVVVTTATASADAWNFSIVIGVLLMVVEVVLLRLSFVVRTMILVAWAILILQMVLIYRGILGPSLSLFTSSPSPAPYFANDPGAWILAPTTALALALPWSLAGPAALAVVAIPHAGRVGSFLGLALAFSALLLATSPENLLWSSCLITVSCALPAAAALVAACRRQSCPQRDPANAWLTGVLVASGLGVTLFAVLRILTIFPYMERFQALGTTAAIVVAIGVLFHRQPRRQLIPFAALAIALKFAFVYALIPERNALDLDRAQARGLCEQIPENAILATNYPISMRFRYHLAHTVVPLSHADHADYLLLHDRETMQREMAADRFEFARTFYWSVEPLWLVRRAARSENSTFPDRNRITSDNCLPRDR